MRKSKKPEWYPRFAERALFGMTDLTLEERGAYNTLIDLKYSRDGDLPDDDRLICSHLRCNAKKWHRIKPLLLAKAKMWIVDGQIQLKRVDEEVQRRRHRMKKNHELIDDKCEINRGFFRENSNDFNENGAKPRPNNRITNIESYLDSDDASLRSAKNPQPNGSHVPSVLNDFDFLPEDGAIFIAAKEIAKWQEDFPNVSNVRNRIRGIYRGWASLLPVNERTAAIYNKLRKLNEEATTKPKDDDDEPINYVDRLKKRGHKI